MHDVFISYSHKDAAIADAVCHRFEQAGIRCWYAPRNIQPGQEWAESIVKAIEQTKILVLIFTGLSDSSVQVRREVYTAIGEEKIIIPFKCSDIQPSEKLCKYLSGSHWIDALDGDMSASIDSLLEYSKSLLGITNAEDGALSENIVAPDVKKYSINPKIIIFATAGAVVALIAVVIIVVAINFSKTHSGIDVAADTTNQVSVLINNDTNSEGSSKESSESNTGGINDNYIYSSFKDGTLNLERYIGQETEEVVVPSEIDGVPVSWVGKSCFEGQTILKKVVISEGISALGEAAFKDCNSLQEISIPSTLDWLGDWALARTDISSIVLPERFDNLGNHAFDSCNSLKTVVCPESLTSFPVGSFQDCTSLEKVTIPSSKAKFYSAFDSGSGVTLIGVKGSETEKYALENNLKFEEYKTN